MGYGVNPGRCPGLKEGGPLGLTQNYGSLYRGVPFEERGDGTRPRAMPWAEGGRPFGPQNENWLVAHTLGEWRMEIRTLRETPRGPRGLPWVSFRTWRVSTASAALQAEDPGSSALFQPPPLSIRARKPSFRPGSLRLRAGNPRLGFRNSRFSARTCDSRTKVPHSRTEARVSGAEFIHSRTEVWSSRTEATHSGTESEILALKAGILARNSYILGQKSHPLGQKSAIRRRKLGIPVAIR